MLLVQCVCSSTCWAMPFRGLVENPEDKNLALIVGVSHGLPGIDIDVDNVKIMASDPSYQYQSKSLLDSQGTTSAIGKSLTLLAENVGERGTLFFYFSGHGNVGVIYPQDRIMQVKELRTAIEEGRKAHGPLDRLVLMFDSCHSGSLLDPFRAWLQPFSNDPRIQTALFTDEVARVMSKTEGRAPYWRKLFVFASSRADETSLAGENGSVFTVAMIKAFEEAMEKDQTIEEFIKNTKKYTEGHHPVARLVPATLASEKMRSGSLE